MIPAGLKIGDTFTEGFSIYEILSLYPDGTYKEARRIGFTQESFSPYSLPFAPVSEEEDKDPVQLDSFNKYTKTEINRLNNAELTKVCEQLGLEVSTGLAMKKAIIEKLGL